MFEYWNIDKFISKKADLYNYINPFFDLNYLKSHNFFYISYALDLYKSYFDNIYINIDPNIRLDINQRIAILTNSQSELIIAGAGSGKTTTIAAKIKFMVDILKIEPEFILLLSYTNEAVLEMKKIIVDKFKIEVRILTFHKFAILLLNSVKNIKDHIDYKDIKITNNKQKCALNLCLYMFYNLTLVNIVNHDCKYKEALTFLEEDIKKYYFEKIELKKNFKSLIIKKLYEKISSLFINEIDTFDSIIYKAFKLNEYVKKFKYILIDEYQDISNLRYRFIQKYVRLNNSFLVAVGDDWQTIFSFASSNINNILNFNNFKDATILKIVNTYRNSQELINIAGKFIMANKKQIAKKLKSNKSIKDPIELIPYSNNSEAIRKVASIIEKIKDKKIAILTRYKFDIFSIVDNKTFKIENNKLIYSNEKEIYFYTIHSSKGLGFDYVFLINNKKGYYGFPPKRRKNSFFKEENCYLEERRLFYVALTRTKNKVYLIYPRKKHSVFLKETKKMLKKNFNLL